VISVWLTNLNNQTSNNIYKNLLSSQNISILLGFSIWLKINQYQIVFWDWEKFPWPSIMSLMNIIPLLIQFSSISDFRLYLMNLFPHIICFLIWSVAGKLYHWVIFKNLDQIFWFLKQMWIILIVCVVWLFKFVSLNSWHSSLSIDFAFYIICFHSAEMDFFKKSISNFILRLRKDWHLCLKTWRKTNLKFINGN
jgi:hypothetical protein